MEPFTTYGDLLFLLNAALVHDVTGMREAVVKKLEEMSGGGAKTGLRLDWPSNRTVVYKKDDWNTMRVFELDIHFTKAEVVLHSHDDAKIFYSACLKGISEFLKQSVRQSVPRAEVARRFGFSLTVYRPVGANSVGTASTPVLLNLIKPPIARETVLGRDLGCDMIYEEYLLEF